MKEGEKVENDRNPLGVKIVLCDLNEFIREYYRFSYVLLSVVSGRVVCWLSFISLFHMRLSTKPPQKRKKRRWWVRLPRSATTYIVTS